MQLAVSVVLAVTTRTLNQKCQLDRTVDSSLFLGAEGCACKVMAPDGQFNLGCRELNLYPRF